MTRPLCPLVLSLLLLIPVGVAPLAAQEETDGTAAIAPETDCASAVTGPREYHLLATSKTSTMERELNAAAEEGYRLEDVMGGETAFGGSEVAAVMCRLEGSDAVRRYEYRLLATKKTSTMQDELQAAGDAGYEYRGQTVFNTAFGDQEVVVLLERDLHVTEPAPHEYRLLATKRTSTMQKELDAAGAEGFELVGLTVSSTFFGGAEVVAILRRSAPVEAPVATSADVPAAVDLGEAPD